MSDKLKDQIAEAMAEYVRPASISTICRLVGLHSSHDAHEVFRLVDILCREGILCSFPHPNRTRQHIRIYQSHEHRVKITPFGNYRGILESMQRITNERITCHAN